MCTSVGRVRGRGGQDGGEAVLVLGGRSPAYSPAAAPPAPTVSVRVCSCPGSVPGFGHDHPPETEFEQRSRWGRRPPDPDRVPWWDARASPERRRAMLAALLIAELQAGVMLRAVYEAARVSA